MAESSQAQNFLTTPRTYTIRLLVAT